MPLALRNFKKIFRDFMKTSEPILRTLLYIATIIEDIGNRWNGINFLPFIFYVPHLTRLQTIMLVVTHSITILLSLSFWVCVCIFYQSPWIFRYYSWKLGKIYIRTRISFSNNKWNNWFQALQFQCKPMHSLLIQQNFSKKKKCTPMSMNDRMVKIYQCPNIFLL